MPGMAGDWLMQRGEHTRALSHLHWHGRWLADAARWTHSRTITSTLAHYHIYIFLGGR